MVHIHVKLFIWCTILDIHVKLFIWCTILYINVLMLLNPNYGCWSQCTLSDVKHHFFQKKISVPCYSIESKVTCLHQQAKLSNGMVHSKIYVQPCLISKYQHSKCNLPTVANRINCHHPFSIQYPRYREVKTKQNG